ncbi:MAG: Wzt carbohydrate-binding domain-containing protein [Roseiflexaceae bacterium]
MTITPLIGDERGTSATDFWPSSSAFLDLSQASAIASEHAYCTGVAMCDDEGRPTQHFFQGQTAHFYYEFEIRQPIDVPSGGVEIHDALGRLIHGKNTFQYETTAPHAVDPGTRLRFHHSIRLDVGPGDYRFSVGLANTSIEHYRGYKDGTIADVVFRETARELCRMMHIASFRVELDPAGRLLHHGLANLPGDCRISTIAPAGRATTAYPTAAIHRWSVANLLSFGRRNGTSSESSVHKAAAPAVSRDGNMHASPTVFHITHWKAGSQWIHKILMACIPERIIAPQVGEGQFLYWPIQPGKIYPTVYVTYQQFAAVKLPDAWRHFVIIRDLRDTLISAYFSQKISHPEDLTNAALRERLQALSFEEGLILLMDEWLPACARIQLTWQEAGERLIRYEDLLEHDLEILEPLLLDECQLPIEPMRLREIIQANRFEQLTQGRARGEEDVTAHERKGIAGDWRNYFSDEITRRFKNRFGGILIATGYERDFGW